jgi:hypothetical protein
MNFRWLPITSLQSLFAEFVPALLQCLAPEREAEWRTDGAASELFFDRQLRVTTDVPPRLLRLLRSRGGPARRPAHLRLRSAQRAPDYSPPGLAPLRRRHKTHRRGSVPSCANGGAQTKSPAEAGPVKREKSNETGRQSHLLPGKIEVMGGKAVLQAVQTRQRHGRPGPASLTKPVAHIIHGQPGHAVPRPPPGRRCWSVPLTVFSRLKTHSPAPPLRVTSHHPATLAPSKGLPAASNNRATCTADHLPPRRECRAPRGPPQWAAVT